MNDSKNNKSVNNGVEIKIQQFEEDIKNLATTIDKVEDEKLVIQNQLKKALADYQNLERSIGERIEVRVNHLKKDMAQSIIEVLDDLNFALEARQKLNLDAEALSWVEGVVASMRKISKALETLGVYDIVVNPGDQFDSNIHEAMVAIDPVDAGDKPGCIKQVVQNGYRISEFVIRPARVIVIKK